MRHTLTPHPLGSSLRPALASLACLFILLGTPALGQSGRKQKKPTPEPPVQGVSQPPTAEKAEPEPPSEKPKEKGPMIMVATDMPDLSISPIYADIAREGCVRELREVRSLELRESRNQNRADAIKAAKQDDRTYVVWMQLEVDRLSSSMGGFDLRYTIFEPKTGKVVGMGSGYPVANDRLPPIGGTRGEILLDRAGRDVARQVLKKLHLKDL